MAYFSNGTEGDMYLEKWCERCMHYQNGQACTVLLLHLLHNYEECNKKDSFLHKLIPMREDGFAGECTMFIEVKKHEGT